MGKAVADNMECANALERFKQKFFDPLKKRMDKNHEYIFKGGYEAEMKKKGVDPDEDVITRMKKKYDENTLILNEAKLLYDASFKMVQRHEAVIDELSRIHVGIRDNILWEGDVPEALMEEQRDMLDDYFKSIQKILKPIKLEE